MSTATTPRALVALNVVSFLLILAALGMAFFYAPMEATMGQVQRVFYFHLGAFMGASLAFLVTVVAGVMYLRTRSKLWDTVGVGSVEIGLTFSAITILSGPIWASIAWGKPWDWDPRLTTVTIMWLIYAALLMLRNSLEDPDRRARFGAIYGIVAFLSVIGTFVIPRILTSITNPHPTVIGPGAESGAGAGAFAMTAPMSATLMFTGFAFVVLYFTLLWHRVRLQKLADRIDALKMKVLSR
ncbi:MAG: cytochrome c biogenesis protein CcsA [Anaerolineae bacterium]|nr:cytochrome c biogenesis protein CcsA [Anaerolineae bacterium]